MPAKILTPSKTRFKLRESARRPLAPDANMLAAGVSLFVLSCRMGTSLAMIDVTYGHLAPDAEEQERALLDAYDVRMAVGG